MLTLRLHENNIQTAHLRLNSRSIERLSGLIPSVIDITSRFAPERQRIETFIRNIYRDSYQADIAVTYAPCMGTDVDDYSQINRRFNSFSCHLPNPLATIQ